VAGGRALGENDGSVSVNDVPRLGFPKFPVLFFHLIDAPTRKIEVALCFQCNLVHKKILN